MPIESFARDDDFICPCIRLSGIFLFLIASLPVFDLAVAKFIADFQFRTDGPIIFLVNIVSGARIGRSWI